VGGDVELLLCLLVKRKRIRVMEIGFEFIYLNILLYFLYVASKNCHAIFLGKVMFSHVYCPGFPLDGFSGGMDVRFFGKCCTLHEIDWLRLASYFS